MLTPPSSPAEHKEETEDALIELREAIDTCRQNFREERGLELTAEEEAEEARRRQSLKQDAEDEVARAIMAADA